MEFTNTNNENKESDDDTIDLCDFHQEDKKDCCCKDGDDDKDYYAYGMDERTIKVFNVGGGGLGNGNHSATIEWDEKEGEVYYCEYGKNPKRELIGNDIEFGDSTFRVKN